MALFGETTAASVRSFTHRLNSFRDNFPAGTIHLPYCRVAEKNNPIVTFQPRQLKLTYALGVSQSFAAESLRCAFGAPPSPPEWFHHMVLLSRYCLVD